MRNLIEILSGMGLLIGIYLFLSRPDSAVKIIDVIAKNGVNGVKALQGRG